MRFVNLVTARVNGAGALEGRRNWLHNSFIFVAPVGRRDGRSNLSGEADSASRVKWRCKKDHSVLYKLQEESPILQQQSEFLTAPSMRT
jgi:hypothetical protein